MSHFQLILLQLFILQKQILCLPINAPLSTTLAPTTPFQLTYTTLSLTAAEIESKSADNRDGSLSTTEQLLDAYPMNGHSHSSSVWPKWITSPFFILSAVGSGVLICTLFTVIVCCYWRSRGNKRQKLEMHHHISETAIVPHHSYPSMPSKMSDARSMISRCSNQSNASVRSIALAHSAQSASAHFDDAITPSLVGVSHQVIWTLHHTLCPLITI